MWVPERHVERLRQCINGNNLVERMLWWLLFVIIY